MLGHSFLRWGKRVLIALLLFVALVGAARPAFASPGGGNNGDGDAQIDVTLVNPTGIANALQNPRVHARSHCPTHGGYTADFDLQYDQKTDTWQSGPIADTGTNAPSCDGQGSMDNMVFDVTVYDDSKVAGSQTNIQLHIGQTKNLQIPVQFPNSTTPPTIGDLTGHIFYKSRDGVKSPAPAGVQVSLDDGHGHTYTTTTAADGSYRIDNIAPGTYTIHIQGSSTSAQGAIPILHDQPNFKINAGDNTYDFDQGGTYAISPPDEKVCTSGDGIAGALAAIICPAVQIIASATQFFENNIIIPFLTVSPFTTNDSNPVYILWKDFRDLANVVFIVLLFISIFSIALSKYGLKRVLPRLLLALIGANLSYFVIAFVADAFNIFGAGISQLIIAAFHQANVTQLNGGTSAGAVQSIFTLGGAALLTVVLSGGAALGWLFSFIGIAALVIFITVVVLVLRQIAIIMLAIVAPIPIILALLPNAENYYHKWRELLIQLFAMYPEIVLLFAAGKIFGLILQQPDFKLAGNGVSDEVAQSIRVILQFLVYVIPLAFLPFVFTSSGFLMKRAYSFLNNSKLRQAAQQPGQSFRENVVKPKRQELRVRAAARGGPIGWAAGYGMRRDQKRADRERELNRAKQGYIANKYLQPNSSLTRSAARGVGGAGAATRAQGAAMAGLEAERKQDIANEATIFGHELRQLGMSAKEFNNAFSDYLRNPSQNIITGKLRDGNGTLRTIDLAQRTDLTRSALNSAAAAGEITTIEQARLSGGINQGMLDDVIRTNESALKGKGGYHLTSNFNLANGRSQGTQRDVNIARLRSSFAAGGEDIAGMKASFVNAVRSSLRNPVARNEILTGANSLTTAERQAVRDNINTALRDPDISASAKNVSALRDIAGLI